MVNTFISLLFAGAVASAVQVGFAPAATSFIYRSDNNGPASLIQLGGHGYEQPHAFAAPIPIAQPLNFALEGVDNIPAPHPYVPIAQPVAVDDAEDDDESEESSEDDGEDLVGPDPGHSFERGGGSDYDEQHHSNHGQKRSKLYHSKNYHANGAAGDYSKEHKEGYSDEVEGEKGSEHDEAAVYGKHDESGKNYKGGDHGHKRHFSKGEEVTGYHKVFNKDEFKKDHDFYDVADKSGHFKKHGYENAHHGSAAGGHKKGEKNDAGFNKGDFGKAGFHSNGNVDVAEAGHSAENGKDSHYRYGDSYGKKGGSNHEKEYEYDDDDEDDDDDDENDDE